MESNQDILLKRLSNSILFLDRDTIDSYYDELKSGKLVSEKLLKDLINNDNYFLYVDKLFKDEIGIFHCGYLLNGDITGSIHLIKKEIAIGLKQLYDNGKLELNEKTKERYDYIINHVSYDYFKSLYKDREIYSIVDGKKVTVSFNSIIKFLELGSYEYEDFFIINNNEILNGNTMEVFIYVLINFFNTNEIISNYFIPSSIQNRINSLRNQEIIDVEAINKITDTTDDYIHQVNINSELKYEILKNMPNNLTLLEKAIYTYIKMCKLLKYDSEFYAVNQVGEAARKHEDIKRIGDITLENNEVVCYEFNAIYAKLLRELGINLVIHSALVNGFGGGHANLTFRVGKYLVGADSVTKILNGDLIRAKLNYPLEGLYCQNKNAITKEKFKNSLSKIYNIINLEEKEKTIEKDSLDSLIRYYKNLISCENHISIDEKFDILMTKLNDSNLIGMDALSYLLILKKIIFNNEERVYNIKINIIRNNEIAVNKVALPSAVITLNPFDIEELSDNLYYIYNPKEPLESISLKDLNEKFNNGSYEYITEVGIPGIRVTKGSK